MKKIDAEEWLKTIHPNEGLMILAELVNSLIEENGDQNIELLKLRADFNSLRVKVGGDR